jgi:hypothetical protein
MQQSLLLNIIPFTPPVTKAAFVFYKEYQEGYCPVFIDTDLQGLLHGHLTKLEQADTFWLYNKLS